ncbi:hypothetical protein JCM8547_009245 [Rhodosporidiobolus lusitaniae]
MPRVQEPDKIPINSPRDLHLESDTLLALLALEETEHTWEKINKGVKRFQAVVRGGGCKFTDDFVQVMRDPRMVKGLTRSLATERTALSGTTLELVASCTRLGSHFAGLLPAYLPTVLRLYAKPNKVYVTRAASTVSSIVKNTRLAEVLRYIVTEWRNEAGKSAAFREQAAAAVVVMLGADSGVLAVEKEHLEKRMADLEWLIKTGATGREATVRADMKKCWEVYKREWPERVQQFTAPMTPTIRKYLKVVDNPGGAAPAAPPAAARPAAKRHNPLAASAGPTTSHHAPSRSTHAPTLSTSTSSSRSHPTSSLSDSTHSVGMGLPSQHRSARVEPSRSTSGSTTSPRSASRQEEHHEREHLGASTASSASVPAAPAGSGFKPTAPSAKTAATVPPSSRLASGPKPAARALPSSSSTASSAAPAAAEPRRARRVAAPPAPPPQPAAVPPSSSSSALNRSTGASGAPPPLAAALNRSQASSSHAPFRPKLTTSTVAAAATAAAASAKVKPAAPARAPLATSTSSSSNRPVHKALSSSSSSAAPPPPAPAPVVPKTRAPLYAPTASSRARAKERAASPELSRKPAPPPAGGASKSAAVLAARERRERRAAEAAAEEERKKREKEEEVGRKRKEEEERLRLEKAAEVPLPAAALQGEEEDDDDLVEQEDEQDEPVVEQEVEEVQVKDVKEVLREDEHVEEEHVKEHVEEYVEEETEAVEQDIEEVDEAPEPACSNEPDHAPVEQEEHEAVKPTQEVGMESDLVLHSAPTSQEVALSKQEEQAEQAEPVEAEHVEVDEQPDVVVDEAEEDDEHTQNEEELIRFVRDVPPSPFLAEVPVVNHTSPAREATPRSPSPTPLPTLHLASTPSPISTSTFAATSTPAPAPFLSSSLAAQAAIPFSAPFTPPHLAHVSAPIVHFPSASFPPPPSFAPLSPEPFQTCSIILDTPPRLDELPGAIRLPGRAAPIVAMALPGRREKQDEEVVEHEKVEESEEDDVEDDDGYGAPASPFAARRAASPSPATRPPVFLPDESPVHPSDVDTTFEQSGDEADEQDELLVEEEEQEYEEEPTMQDVEADEREFQMPLNDTSAYGVAVLPSPFRKHQQQDDPEYDNSDSEGVASPASAATIGAPSAHSTPVQAPPSASKIALPSFPDDISFAYHPENDTLDLATVFAQQKALQRSHGYSSGVAAGSPMLMEDESAIFELERPELRFHDETEESESGYEWDTTLDAAPVQVSVRRDENEEEEEADDEEEKEEEHTNVLTRSLRSRVVTVDLESAKTPARVMTRSTRSSKKAAAVLERDVLGEVQA